jgi:uncharacterized protein (TIGR00255 family)
MLESMTGFGRASAATQGYEIVAEVRAVNGRFVEVTVRTPRELAPFEVEIQNAVKANLSRGKINVSIQIERSASEAALTIDEPQALAYTHLLERLRFISGIREPIRLEDLLAFKDIFVSRGVSDTPVAELWAAASEALTQALSACREMRMQEGRALADDLQARLAAIGQTLVAVEARAPERIVDVRSDLTARLAELLGDDRRVDPDRLEMEIAVLADRLDVTEECVRLRSHIDQFRDSMAATEPVGRRLNFLAQELNREINTISAKANDAAVAHMAVSMKEELEKIREQVQNVA